MIVFALTKSHFPKALIIIGALVLAIDPFLWLTRTWMDPSYASSGFWFALVPTAAFVWSVTSPKQDSQRADHSFPFLLLFTSALIRAIGQVMAVNMIGAVTLIIDVYALGRILGFDQRIRAVSPFWLSILFAFSLPIERVLQRILGYGFQNLSADGACALLGGVFDNVSCQGIRILINAKDVMVDLPCSGARGLLLLLFLFCTLNVFNRFKLKDIAIGLGITIAAAYVANVIRICVLSSGVGYPELAGPLNVMSQPTHDMIGFLTLSLGGIPVILWARRCSGAKQQKKLPKKVIQDGWWLNRTTGKALGASITFLIGAVIITTLPKKAFDVTTRDLTLELPNELGGIEGQAIALLPQEQAYFTQYGGSAQKTQYGEQNLLMVKTSAPLRHLHTPDDCLRGLGYKVDYLGAEYSNLPSAIYKATDPSGQSFRVAVSFSSADYQHITTNVSEAVWHWMKNPEMPWVSIQRVSRWDDQDALLFDRAVINALTVQTNNVQLAFSEEITHD